MTTPPAGSSAAPFDIETKAEAYCSTCGRSYAPELERCPDDGARLVQFAAQRDAMIGRSLDGRFEVRQPLGKGGMGTVYRALQISVDREVAVKVVHPRLANDRQAAKRFLREARLASRLNQPNVVHVIDFGQTEDGVLYLVMELLRGRTLASELGGARRFSVRRALTIGLQLCDALEAAHAQGIVHRDLKPGNVVVLDDPPGRDLIKVLDFGLAKSLVADTSQVTNTDAILGTPLYMCPEQVQGKPSDQRGDLYSLGCMLFELLAGSPPFTDDSVNLILAMHLGEPPPPLPAHVPPRLRALIEQLLAKDPGARVQTAGEVRAAMQWVIDSGALAGATEPAAAREANDTVPEVDLEFAATAAVDRPTTLRPSRRAAAVASGGEGARASSAVSDSTVRPRSSSRRALVVLAVVVVVVGALAVMRFALPRSRDHARGAGGAPLDAAAPAVVPAAELDAGTATDARAGGGGIATDAAILDASSPAPLDASTIFYDAGGRNPRPRRDAGIPRPVPLDAGTASSKPRVDAATELPFLPIGPGSSR